MTLETVSLYAFLVLAGGFVGALIISFFSQRAHIARLNSALATAVTGLQRPFQIPEEQIAELAAAIAAKQPYSGVRQ